MDTIFSLTWDITDALDAGHELHIESEYDRSVRAYRTMILDEDGNQIGSAAYDGTKGDRDASRAAFEREIARVKGA